MPYEPTQGKFKAIVAPSHKIYLKKTQKLKKNKIKKVLQKNTSTLICKQKVLSSPSPAFSSGVIQR
jgi:hypothetical protein